MVGLLLEFLLAEHNGNWQLQTETFAQMLFYNRDYDHQKYFKWRTMYLIDKKRLPTRHPDLHDAFMNSFHSVSPNKYPSKFKLVPTDMAFGQSVNRDTKPKGGSYTI